MNARPEMTNGIPNRRRFVKGIDPKKWTYRLIANLPDCGHIEKGKNPEKHTEEKGGKSPKVDSSGMRKNRKVDIWIFPSPRASDTINDRLERMQ